MKKSLALILCGLSLLNCQKQNLKPVFKIKKPLAKVYQIPSKVSYKLEDLCDTEIYEKDITINVFIEDSNILWDYHKYKNEIFGYIKDFFRENQINCKFVYSNAPFEKFSSSDEFGLEIWDAKKDMEKRYFQLITEQDLVPEDNPLHLAGKGYAVTRTGIALVNGGWEKFRDEMKAGDLTIKEIEKQFLEECKGMTLKEYHFKSDIAANICHELGHCMGLFHAEGFIPPLVKKYEKEIPNIMSYCNMKVKSDYSIGYCLNSLQKKLIHSFIAGNNTYKAFIDSQKDLEFFVDNIKQKNNLKTH